MRQSHAEGGLAQGTTGSSRSISDSPQGLLDLITELFLEHGYLVVFIGTAGDNLGIPATGDAAGAGSPTAGVRHCRS